MEKRRGRPPKRPEDRIVRTTVPCSPELLQLLSRLAERTDKSKTDLVEKAVRQMAAGYGVS